MLDLLLLVGSLLFCGFHAVIIIVVVVAFTVIRGRTCCCRNYAALPDCTFVFARS